MQLSGKLVLLLQTSPTLQVTNNIVNSYTDHAAEHS